MPDLSAVAASREVTPSSSTLAELQAKADVLSALLDQLRLIRACPNALLNTTSGLHLQKAFNDLQNFAEDVQSPAAQVALATAKKLGTEDPAGIDPYAMRVEERARKRR